MVTCRARISNLLRNVWRDIHDHHTMTMAAGLSYYFVLSLFPLLILAAAVLAYLPIPHLFDAILATLAQVVPGESMGMVRRVVATVVKPHTALLTLGLVGTLWTASSGFAGLIGALNVAYDVPEKRPIWKTRLLAIGLMFVVGALFVTAFGLLLLGPKVAEWLGHMTGVDELLRLWPYLRWSIAVAFTVFGVEFLYFWAPNVKQRFLATLPGAVVGVAFFIAASYGLEVYFGHFANYNKTYGVLGAAIALLVWLNYSWFAILVGAEINSELVKAGSGGKLELKTKAPQPLEPVAPGEGRPAA